MTTNQLAGEVFSASRNMANYRDINDVEAD